MRGDGRIYLRGKNYWIAYYLRGRQFRESTGETDPVKAGKFLKRRLTEVGADQLGIQKFTTPQVAKTAIHELIEALKADYELRGKASPQNLSVLKRVDTDFGAYRAVDLTAEKVDKYIEQRLVDGDRPATINRATQMLGQAYALAVKRETLTRAPYIRHLSEAGNARQGFLSEAEFRTLHPHLPEYLRDFVHFGLVTGMRKGEIASLTWSDVEVDVLTLRGEKSKNGEARTIPIIGELDEIIERRKTARRIEESGTTRMAEFVFHCEGEPIREFRKSWATACVAAGLGKMVCPDCGAKSADKECTQCEAPTKYSGRLFP